MFSAHPKTGPAVFPEGSSEYRVHQLWSNDNLPGVAASHYTVPVIGGSKREVYKEYVPSGSRVVVDHGSFVLT